MDYVNAHQAPLPPLQVRQPIHPDGKPAAYTLEKILVQALEHFSTYGYTGASVREITNASSVTKPTLYYYFKNKEELYREVADRSFNQVLTVLQGAAIGSSTTYETLRNMTTEFIDFCRNNPSTARLVHMLSLGDCEGNPDVGINEFRSKIITLISNILQKSAMRGEIAASKIKTTSFLIHAFLQYRLTSFVVAGHPEVEQETLEDALNCILNGSKG